MRPQLLLLCCCLSLLSTRLMAKNETGKAELYGKITEPNGKPIEAVTVGIASISRGIAIYANKKTEVIAPERLDANLSMNVSRQVFAKMPGVIIWENAGVKKNRSWIAII